MLQLLALLVLERGAAAESLALIEEAIALRPRHAQSHLLAVRAARAAGSLDAATAHARQAAALAPDAAEAACLLAVCLLDAGDAAGACESLQRTVARHPRHAPAFYEWGRALRANHDDDGALAAFVHSIEIDPGLAAGWFALSLIHQDHHRPGDASVALERYLALRPDDVEATFNLGLVRQQLGWLDGALDCYSRVYRWQPALFGRIANALCSEPHGRIWLDPNALRRELARARTSAGLQPSAKV